MFTQQIFTQKNFHPKNFHPNKNFQPKKIDIQKILPQKFSPQKNVQPKKILLGKCSEMARKLVKSLFLSPWGPNIQISDLPLSTWDEHSCTLV